MTFGDRRHRPMVGQRRPGTQLPSDGVPMGERPALVPGSVVRTASAAEGRAEAIIQASSAILCGVGSVRGLDDPDALLGTILKTIVAQLGEDGGGVWLYDEERDLLRLQINFDRGRVESRQTSGHPGAIPEESGQHELNRAAHNGLYRSKTARQFGPDILYGDPTWLPYQAYFRSAGVRALLSVPLFAGPAFLGCVTVRATRRDRFSESEVAFAQAIADQAAIGLHIDRLGKVARLAAVAQEREKAALDRAAELRRANAALRDGLAVLADGIDIQAFLRHQVRLIADHFGAVEAGLWVQADDPGGQLLWLSLEDGRVVDAAASRHPLAGTVQPKFPGNPLADRLHVERKPVLFPVAQYRDASLPWYDPAVADQLEAAGTRAVLLLPLLVGDAEIGSLALRLPSAEPLPESRLELAQALASQSALALHLSRLATAEREAAVAREQADAAMRRAEVLARANSAIRSSLDRLAESQDIDAFLDQVAVVATRELGAVGAGIWVRQDGSNLHSLVVSYEDGEIRRRGRFENPGVQRADDESYPILRRGEINVDAGEALRAKPWYSEYREYLEARGIVAIVSVPLFIGERWVGAIVLRHTSVPDWPNELHELAHALANQVALALEFTRLADAAREAAVVSEREAAARARAEKLAVANLMLRESAERLGAIEDIDAFLGQVLLTIANLLSARSGAVWTDDQVHRVAHLRYIVEDGNAVPAARSGHPNATTPVPDPAEDPMQARGTPAARPMLIGIDAVKVPDSTKDYLRGLGAKAILAVPMVFAGEHIGSFTVRLDSMDPLDGDHQELVQALANQAAVALHLTRLAEQARRTAAAQAREEAATRRAAELAKANAALAQSIATLSAEGDLDAYLGGMLRILLEQMGSDSGSLWCIDAEGWYRLHTEVVDGRFKALEGSDHPGAKQGISAAKRGSASAQRSHDIQAAGRRPVVYPDVAPAPEYEGEEETRAYLLSIGVRSQLIVPMFSGERHLGTFSVRSPVVQAWSAEQTELAQALGNQAALAIEISRLSAEVREKAVAQAREEAATLRATELAKANAALARSITNLPAEGDLDAYLDGMLRALLDQMGTDSGCLWCIDAEGWYHLHTEVVGGRVVPLDRTDHPGARTPISSRWENNPAAQASHDLMTRQRQPVVNPDIATAPEYDDDEATRAYLLSLGMRAQLIVPMFSGDRHLGSYSVRSREPRVWTSEEKAFAQALGNQAALAIEMSRLGTQARDAAVARAGEATARARAEKIAAANRLMLGPVGDLDTLLGRVLLSINELLRGHSATLWTLDTAANELHLRFVVEDGTAIPAARSSHPRARTPRRVPAAAADLMPNYGSSQVRPHQSRIAETRAFTDEQKAYFASLGVLSLVAVPIVLNNEHLGDIAIRLADDRQVLEEDYELVQTLANQAALALHLSRAAEEARRAALVDERNRMAREIHDTLAQGFAAIALQLQAAERAAGSLASGVSGPLGIARRLAHDNLIEARRSLDILKSGSTATLAAGLSRLVDSMRRAGEARIELDLRPVREPPGDVAHELLRIVQEALTNATLHARARTVTLSLWPSGDGGVTLQVADDGIGFDPDATGSGFGLTGMHERALAIGSRLTVISEVGAGTEVVVSWSGTAPRAGSSR